MRRFILSTILCVLCLTGCQKTKSEPEGEDGILLNEKDTSMSETNNSIERINEYMILDQSFDIALDDWGDVTFVSCMPMADSDGDVDPYADVSFYLLADGQIVYRFPYVNIIENDVYAKEDNIRQRGMIDQLEGISFVMFKDVNGDLKDDVVIGILYDTGAGLQGAISRIEVRIYENSGSEFIYDESLCAELWDLPYDTTAEDVKSLLGI